jgi:hypothetical protein
MITGTHELAVVVLDDDVDSIAGDSLAREREMAAKVHAHIRHRIGDLSLGEPQFVPQSPEYKGLG